MRFVVPPKPVQVKPPPPGVMGLVEVDSLVRFERAHGIATGVGVTAAVLDTGCFTEHLDFSPSDERIAARANCMTDQTSEDVSDVSGHGTHVTGALAANGPHVGVAPACRIVPVKILLGTDDDKSAQIRAAIARGLNWVLDNAEAQDITVVCLSVGDAGNYADDQDFGGDAVTEAVLALAERNIPVVAAAGNFYGKFSKTEPVEGMCFPAILRQTVSVGAVYDQPCDNAAGRPCKLGPEYGSPSTQSSEPDQLTIYTQRMAKADEGQCGTDIFAPGSWVLSTGTDGDNGSSIVKQGTSQAAPIVAGVIALLQSLHFKHTGEKRPPIATLKKIMSDTAIVVSDDSLVTNVKVTNKTFLRVDAFAAVQELARRLGQH
ncbi:S8 family serine peptidase [Mesorhizobium sp. B263B2A]|uniref:S8 family serine peptidase n=1 Tax=Mesorhizobium sp. B263B2A TaxID=2876669 RepID=UPI001CD04481|nr:S8 family serine peptidase [Mesorhizobium sp. B263B2A]MCA0033894.1 S8 family serine peptidase [Mesorhizobium sp. B263B2A]